MTKEEKEEIMIDHLGQCEPLDAILCERCQKILTKKQIAYADEDGVYCEDCYDQMTAKAENEYQRQREEGEV